jgi:hypothetical protein
MKETYYAFQDGDLLEWSEQHPQRVVVDLPKTLPLHYRVVLESPTDEMDENTLR